MDGLSRRQAERRAMAEWNRRPCPLCARPARNAGRYGGVVRSARLWWDGWQLACRWGHVFDDPKIVGEWTQRAAETSILI